MNLKINLNHAVGWSFGCLEDKWPFLEVYTRDLDIVLSSHSEANANEKVKYILASVPSTYDHVIAVAATSVNRSQHIFPR
jgi:hypothetical protein